MDRFLREITGSEVLMLDDALQRRLQFSEALNRLSEMTLCTEDPTTLLHALARIAGEALEVDRAVVYDVRLDEGEAVLLAHWLSPGKSAMVPAVPVYPVHLMAEAVADYWSRRTWLESHAAAPNPLLGSHTVDLVHRQMKIVSVLSFPFSFREHGFHLLVFNQFIERVWKQEELDFISAVSRHMSLALLKLKLVEGLAASQARYRALYDHAPSMFFTVNAERKVISLNRFAVERLGYPSQELLGADVLGVFVPEDREGIQRQLEGCFAHPGEVYRWEARKVCKDGSAISVRENARAGLSTSGKLEALIVCDDVTEQKRTEQAMLQTQKLETLGVLVGGISHDFNNLLGAIVGNAELGLMQLPVDSPAREPVELAARAALRAGELVKQLLSYSARAPFTRQRVSINEVVRELADLLVVTVGKRARVVLELDPKSPVVVTDPTQLRQVLINLVHNAADAMEGREGSVCLRTSVVALEAKNPSSLPAGPYARIEVIDAGVGIDAERLERIFDPFFTTKVAGRGLGLSAVRSIAQRHGGQVLVESKLGVGSTFSVLLPAAPAEVVSEAPAPPPTATELPRGATVLVVDDDQGVRRVLASILRQLGLVALTAGGTAEGRELFKAHPEIRWVLMDLTMPEGGGAPLVKEFHALRPAAPILLISGFAESEVTAAMAGDLSGFLAKPFTPMELKAALVRSLSPGPAPAG